MDAKDIKNNWRPRMKKWKYLLAVVACISLMLILTFFVVIGADKNNMVRYREENYKRLQNNIEAFSQTLSATDTLCENMRASVFALPLFEELTLSELSEQLLAPEEIVGDTQVPFEYASTGYRLFGRMQGIVLIDQNYSDMILCNPNTGVSIAVTQNGYGGGIYDFPKGLQENLKIQGDLSGLRDGELVTAAPSGEALSEVYVARWVNDYALLLCGLTEYAWENSLLFNNCGRSYQLEQILWRPEGGRVFYGNKDISLSALGLTEKVIDSKETNWKIGKYTLMKFDVEHPSYTMLAVMTETGSTSVFTSDLFGWLVIINILWLLIVTMICVYMLVRIYKPLREIARQLSVEDESADSLERIAQAIHAYDRQLTSNRLTISEQVAQLRHACLKLLMMDQVPSITPTQMNELGIPALLERFVLITIYPNDGHWVQGDGSEQETSYRNHVVITTIQELLNPHITDARTEFLLFEECLLLVVPVTEETEEDELRQKAERWVMNLSAHLNKRFLFGISKVRCGQENFSRAYHDAMRRAALVEERESGRSEDITLNMLLKQNMQMTDLVYMERYNDAFACMKEMLETLSKQKSRHLRNQQLSSLLSITYCMLTETNKTNSMLMEQMNLNASELTKAESEAEALQKWETVFTQLEKHKDERLQGQFSDEFASIYQYLYAHYKDPDISLSLLAEQFEMSLSTLSREFQKNTGQGFLECLHRMRVDAAKYEIEHSGTPLSEIAEAVGYTNTLTMTRAFKKYLGATPSTFRRKDAS